MADPIYTYLACDLMTNAVIAELPLTGVSYSQALNGCDTLDATLPLAGLSSNIDVEAATAKGRVALYVDCNGALEWGGIVWSRTYDSDQGGLVIQAAEFVSYYQRRHIRDPLSWSQQARLDIVTRILQYAASQPGGDIGLQVIADTSTDLMDLAYTGTDLREIYSELTTLSQDVNGFDFAQEVQYNNGAPQKILRLSYPRRGQTAGATQLLWELPANGGGNMYGYKLSEDGGSMADWVAAAGAGSPPLIGTASDQSLLDAGVPLLEAVVSYSTVQDQAELDGLALGNLGALRDGVNTLELRVDPRQDPLPGAYTVGDDARVRITDWRYPSTLDTFYRITSIKTTPPEGSNVPLVTLTMGPVAQ